LVVEAPQANRLLDDDEFFVSFFAHNDCRSAIVLHVLVSRLDGLLDVLWVVIHPAKNNQILESPRDKQLAIALKTQIARA